MPLLRLQDSADTPPLKKHAKLCGSGVAPLDLVLHQKECFIEHPKHTSKMNATVQRISGKRCRVSLVLLKFQDRICNSNHSWVRCCSEKTLNFLTIQQPLRSWNQRGLVAQLRASWWRYVDNCGCWLEHQLWRGGDHDDFLLHPTISGHFRALLWEAAFLVL